MVYVINIQGNPLMPCKEAKARKLLKSNKAKIINYCPFIIQLLFECENRIQPTTLGVDAGSRRIGLSVVTDKEELFSAEVALRNDIVKNLSVRRQNRRTRRNRLRYRKPRFKNRVSSKNNGWLVPSIEHKIQTHLKIVDKVYALLPVTKIIVEIASFDIQKIKNPDIEGTEYQQGEQLGFWNVRAYVLHRDGHKCQGKKGCANKILNVHHIQSRQIGGDAPSNLITLCEECHQNYHNSKLKLSIARGKSFKDAIFMGVMRWGFYNKLKELYPNVSMTYGYITKNARIINQLEKSHRIDARCITGHPLAKASKEHYLIKKVRCHNRQIHKAKILKGGIKKLNQAPYIVKGFRLFDKVEYLNQECFIFGRRSSGSFDIRKLDGTKLSAGVSYKKLNLLQSRKNILWERRYVGDSSHK